MKCSLVSFVVLLAALSVVAGQTATGETPVGPNSIPLEDIRPATGAVYGTGDPSAPKGDTRPDGLQRAVCDFDGDGKTDYVTVRGLTSTSVVWYILRSGTGAFQVLVWGMPSDYFVPGDYDGDGKWDVAVYRPGAQGYFYILLTLSNTVRTLQLGTTGDYPQSSQDYDGDGVTDPTVTRNNVGFLTWYIQRSALGPTTVYFGVAPADVPVRGDFDGDGKADLAVYRSNLPVPNPNTFFVLRSSDGILQAQNWGNPQTDTILPADFDGDGKTDYTVFRETGPQAGTWYWLRSSDSAVDYLTFGLGTAERAVPGDYDGDGKSDQAVWRIGPGSVFYVNRSLLGFTSLAFGSAGDLPIAYALQAR